MQRILIVEDEQKTGRYLQQGLVEEGYQADLFNNGRDGLGAASKGQYDLIILDVMLPFLDGWQIISALRESVHEEPVLFLTAKDNVRDKVKGLELGADDYMEKPFDSKELVARVKAVLRRYKPAPAISQSPDIKCVEYPDLIINQTNYSVIYMGKTVDMPPKELELLYFLASSPNHVFTREQLLDQIWGYEYIGDTRTVDVHIKRLREKISDHANWKIATIWGIGYKFEVRQ